MSLHLIFSAALSLLFCNKHGREQRGAACLPLDKPCAQGSLRMTASAVLCREDSSFPRSDIIKNYSWRDSDMSTVKQGDD